MTEPDTVDTFRISRWTAEFVDPKVEAAMRAHSLPLMVSQLRIGLYISALGMLVFALFDYTSLGNSVEFYELLAMRVLLMTAILVFAVMVRRYPVLAANGYGTSVVEVLAFALMFVLFAYMPTDLYPWLVIMTMIMLFGAFAFLPNRLVLAGAVAAFGFAGTILSMVPLGLKPSTWGIFTIILLIPVSLGVVVGYRYQIVGRKAFAELSRAQTAHAALESEVEMRRQLEAELREQATTDPLTGLYNRRHYEALFAQELARARTRKRALSLCVLDIDYFKRINDSHGHSVGDLVLRGVAELCRAQLRGMDVVGRLGGEEFVIMLPDTDLATALAVAERLRQRLADIGIVIGQDRLAVTVSIGVAQMQPGDQGVDDLIRRADAALYTAKRAGRNRIQAAA